MIADFDKYPILQNVDMLNELFLRCLEYKDGVVQCMRNSFGSVFETVNIDVPNLTLASNIIIALKRLQSEEIEDFFRRLEKQNHFPIISNILDELTEMEDKSYSIDVIPQKETEDEEIFLDPAPHRIDLRKSSISMVELSEYVLSAHHADANYSTFKIDLHIEAE